jgi:hypothetical protein
MIKDWKITLWGPRANTLNRVHMHQMTELVAKATALADWRGFQILECIPEDAKSDIHPSWF